MNTRMCTYLPELDLGLLSYGAWESLSHQKKISVFSEYCKSQITVKNNIPLHILLGYFNQCNLDLVIYSFKDHSTESHSYEYWFWVGSSNSCEFSPSSAFDCDQYKNYTLFVIWCWWNLTLCRKHLCIPMNRLYWHLMCRYYGYICSVFLLYLHCICDVSAWYLYRG